MQIVQENLSHLRPIRGRRFRVSRLRVAEAIQTAQVPDNVKVKTSGIDDLPTVIAGGREFHVGISKSDRKHDRNARRRTDHHSWRLIARVG